VVVRRPASATSPTGYGAEDDEWLGSIDDGGGEWRVGGVERDVLLAGEEAKECTALACDLVADCAAEHGIDGLEGVEDGGDGGCGCNVERDFVARDASEDAKVGGEFDAY